MLIRNRISILLSIILCSFSTIKSQSVGGVTSGSIAFCDTINSGFISLTGQTGNILYWESSPNNGANWINLSNPTPTQSYNNLNQTTWFRAIVKLPGFPTDTSTISIVTVHPKAIGGTVIGGGNFCNNSGPGTLNLTSNVGNVINWEQSINNGPWTLVSNTTNVLNYSNITVNTKFRAIVKLVPSCPIDSSTIAFINISPNTIAGTLSSNATVCNGANSGTLNLTGSIGNILNWNKSIDNGVTWQTIANTTSSLSYTNITQTTQYKVDVKSGSCPLLSSNTVQLTVVNAQVANAGPDKTINKFETITLNGSGNGTVQWDPPTALSSAFVLNPSATPLTTTTYTLTIIDANNCVSEDSVTINVFVPIPTAFSPNADGVNDVFEIDDALHYPNNTFTVFNRWGMKVFEIKGYKNDWSGTSQSGNQLPEDTYFYLMDFGNTNKESLSGSILIKR